jgi:hypothetical protein
VPIGDTSQQKDLRYQQTARPVLNRGATSRSARFGPAPIVAKLGLGFVECRAWPFVVTPGTLTISVIDQNQRSSGGVLAEPSS